MSFSVSNREALMIKPHIARERTIDDPPSEKKGRGIPVEGRAPQTTAQFKRD